MNVLDNFGNVFDRGHKFVSGLSLLLELCVDRLEYRDLMPGLAVAEQFGYPLRSKDGSEKAKEESLPETVVHLKNIVALGVRSRNLVPSAAEIQRTS